MPNQREPSVRIELDLPHIIHAIGFDRNRHTLVTTRQHPSFWMPDDQAEIPCRSVVNLEFPLVVGHDEVRVVEDTDKSVHPAVNAATDRNGTELRRIPSFH